MKPAAFDYIKAASLAEALGVLAERGEDARILAGGQSLLPMLNMRLARPGALIDIMGLADLRRIEDRGDHVVIGAAVRQCELEHWPALSERLPLVHALMSWIGHPQTRSRGAVCGSIAHADPSAELLTALAALDGSIRLRSRRGARTLAFEDFVLGTMTTAHRADELIESISLPTRQPGAGYAFREVGRRRGDFAIVACAAIVSAGACRLTVGGVADRPSTAHLPALDDPGFADAINAFAWSLSARDDLHATARYRRDLVRQMGRLTLEEAAACRT